MSQLQAMRTHDITATIGTRVEGIDVTDGISGDVADALYGLLLTRGVLVLPNQALTPQGHVALAESFGPVGLPHPLYPRVPGHDQINIIRNDENHPPENEVWHSDLSCRVHPPFVSVLRAHTIPPVGGDTLWADMRAVHDSLSPVLREMLGRLSAEHTLEQGFAFLTEFGHADRQESLSRTDPADNRAVHPVIVRHPADGRPIVYVNESFTTRIPGMAPTESRAILGILFDAVRNPRFQMRHRWAPDTVVIWDNWATQHFACGDHYPAFREVQRVTVSSNARSGEFGTTGVAS